MSTPSNFEVLRWDINNDGLHAAVLHEVEEFNAKDPDAVINQARSHAFIGGNGRVTWVDSTTGQELGLLSDRGYSEDEAVVALRPFGNRVTDSSLVSAEFISSSLARAGVRDEKGDKLPVLVVGSPSGRSGLDVDPISRRQIKHGDFRPAAEAVLLAARAQGFKRVRVMGHSQGGVIALSTPPESDFSGVEVIAVASGDPVCSRNFTRSGTFRGLAKMFSEFGSDSEQLRKEVREAGLDAYTRAQGMEQELTALRRNLQDVKNGFGAAQHLFMNYALASGMARAKFSSLLNMALTFPPKEGLTIGHGTADQMLAPFSEIRDNVATQAAYPPHSRIRLVEVVNARHTWGDDIPAVASFAIDAFSASW